MSVACVLSGGGAKGSFQAGALLALAAHGYNPEHLFGVSVGALHAAVIARHRPDFREATNRIARIWRNLEERQVHRRYWWPVMAVRFALGKTSIYNNNRTKKLIREHVGTEPVPAHVGVVSLASGQYELLPASPEAIFASATMPVYWAPVGEYVDGGVRNVTPLGDAVAAGATEIVVILCNPLKSAAVPMPKNLIEVAGRSLDIAMNEIALGDIQETVRINELVGQAEAAGFQLQHKDGRPYRHIKLTIIEPPVSLGDTLDFDHDRLMWRMELGRATAELVLEEAA